eukprot:COSAG05_NODE_2666_length_2784_cov_2.315829_1_plen_187_part_00
MGVDVHAPPVVEPLLGLAVRCVCVRILARVRRLDSKIGFGVPRRNDKSCRPICHYCTAAAALAKVRGGEHNTCTEQEREREREREKEREERERDTHTQTQRERDRETQRDRSTDAEAGRQQAGRGWGRTAKPALVRERLHELRRLCAVVQVGDDAPLRCRVGDKPCVYIYIRVRFQIIGNLEIMHD